MARPGRATRKSRPPVVVVSVLLIGVGVVLVVFLGNVVLSLVSLSSSGSSPAFRAPPPPGSDITPAGEPLLSVVPPLLGIQSLARRRLHPLDYPRVAFQLVEPSPKDREGEFFEWTVAPTGFAIVKATTLSALSMGLASLFEHACFTTLISWADFSRPSAPCLAKQPPPPPQRHSETALFALRHAFNAVTFSYSGYFWTSSSDWEDQLDWLALRGVNIALANVGFESIYRRALRKVLNVDPLETFFTCEALLPWNRMGNVKNVGGPPSEEYLTSQLALQHFILHRMSELGMTPILHGFNGFVPDEAVRDKSKRLFASKWAGFSAQISDVQRLAPSELSRSISKAIAQEYMEEFNIELAAAKEILFSIDVFNENAPVENEDLSSLGASLVEPLVAGVTSSKPVRVVMQLWFLAHFREFWTRKRAHAFLGGFPRGSLILLDLHGEHRPQWERLGLDGDWAKSTGHSVVWCVVSAGRSPWRIFLLTSMDVTNQLQNFGGANSLGGEVSTVFADVQEAKRVGHHGVGIAPEGFGANELEFDVVLASAWSENHKNFSVWFARWATARYRVRGDQSKVRTAWQCALETVYNRPAHLRGFGPTKSVIEMRPGNGMKHGEFQPTAFGYKLFPAWTGCVRLLLEARAEEAMAWRFDTVDWTRQLLADSALIVSGRVDDAHRAHDSREMETSSSDMLKVVDRLNEVLMLHSAFRMSSLHLDKQSRALITLWHPDNDGALSSYASRQLGGSLMTQVYRKRWALFLNGIQGKGPRMGHRDFKKIEMEWIESLEPEAEDPWVREHSDMASVSLQVNLALSLCDQVTKQQ